MVGVTIFVAVIFYLCKIPGIGPVIFTFALPLSVAIFGLLLFGFMVIVLPLALPTLWDGHSIMATFARLYVIVKERPLMAAVQLLVLTVLVMLAASLAFAIVGMGTAVAVPLSTSIVGGGFNGIGGMGGLAGTMSMLQSSGDEFGGGMSGHVVAGILGLGFAYVVAMAVPMAVYLKGTGIAYLSLIEGLEFGKTEDALNKRMEDVRRRAEAARAAASAAAAPRPKASSFQCSNCNATVPAGNAFCESCGTRVAG
jgi:hypothetical protein